MTIRKMTELNITEKRILIRSDLNVPIENGIIQSDARILAALPTIELALQKKAKVIIMSHLGRPKEGYYTKKYSLFPIFEYFKKKFNNTKIYFSNNFLDGIKLNPGEIALLENTRFNKGELNNDEQLSKKYSDLCDIFVMDAFGSAHRMQSSTYGIGKFVKIACAGLLLISEIDALKKALKKPKRPMVAIVGGSKVSTKFNVLNKLSKIADTIIVGGGIANTFLAIDYKIGKSLYEPDFVFEAKKLRDKYNIIVPIDSRVGKNFCKNEQAIIKSPDNIKEDEEIMDFGDESIKKIISIITQSQTIMWNGPVGVFEFPNFRKGTEMIAKTIANSNAFSIAGGGDTLSVIDMFNIKNNISYISTGGGAFLEFIEGKKLPAIQMLEENFKNKSK
ncbi:phosphoglycerate kinase [Buchnera aphidicola str. APS (Acyrthosiphon pisum)]|uniref:Phosphoglycerate kinase n=2 Tax=Buchnera aphidicola (Acyrthosiphon pisum) TaxID=118099 RepID=PGK_BUCAI|nr:phosphoglycerate kinase [Buchnera aphidicola]B8D7Y0.1 RecName: Full=Phosphoglycerate kinase [Buchnera aphidicola str. Tuc7 (Acyrthosiphon pisum)]P57525.1 RecName: Full=Phosphoglycerate kinase [Buchnera aphidicola str. APS (Acyrthosiphon pisum)]pir/D84982/ phosphoglycerate kinase (EC 2.7.2.3) [imported] - Buchnera sp. (strain APS) [Buchnera sp. (in: enterobacteria)]ADP66835.1 phosphoglycerate kinase [Buchnera aphidicola str. TLW03 (Acyrthosiphon pisum)]ACL30245.1 phosphoglycerate kinase [Buc